MLDSLEVYFAGPVVTSDEVIWKWELANEILKLRPGWNIYVPQEVSETDTKEIFDVLKKHLIYSDVVVAILDGSDSDSGTCWEVGYAFAKELDIIGVKTDFRTTGFMNLMLKYSVDCMIEVDHKTTLKQLAEKIVTEIERKA